MDVIVQHPAAPAPWRPALLVVPTLLSETLARLEGNQLLLDPTAPVLDQLAAVEDAVNFLRTGRAAWGRRVRHLRAVP